MEMEIREYDFEARMTDAEQRQVSGLAVPYGQTIDLGGFQERVERGAFDTTKTVPLFWGHDHKDIPIGRVVAMRDTDNGLEIDAVLNDTDKGENVYRALKAGDVNKFSIGFIPVKSRDDNGVIVREKADLREVSVVNYPAYSKASVTSVREADTKNTKEKIMHENDFSAEIGEIRGELADLSRKFDKVSERDSDAATCQYRNGGEFLKGLYNREDAARTIATRDFATTTDADVTRPAWINKSLKLVEKQRIVKGLFSQAALPASGNSIEYPFVNTTTGTVGQQAAEGDNLSYLEVSIDTATATVKTYGGYSSLSRQAIERSDVAYLETVLKFQTLAYANATEAAVQAALLATSATANAVELNGATGATFGVNATASDWISAVIDAKGEIDDNSKLGLSADFILISKDVHKTIALLEDSTGRPVFSVNADGQNTWGSMPLNGRLVGVIDGTPVVVGKNLPAGTVVVASSEALVSYESAGAPFRLQDENIVNLTKDFSLYGYMAIATPDVKGITFITDAV